MFLITIYSFLLLAGLVCSQAFDLSGLKTIIEVLTMNGLAYIMIGVGMDFVIDKRNIKSYGWDYVVAAMAAALPWLTAAGYIFYFFDINFAETLLLSRFAAPTSAGLLLTMLAAAGFSGRWFFKKTRTLVVFDDLDTVLMIIPVQLLLAGFQFKFFVEAGMAVILLAAAYHWLHALRAPSGKWWILLFATVLTLILEFMKLQFDLDLEILLPAFAIGCLLYEAPDKDNGTHQAEKEEGKNRSEKILDHLIKGGFMLLVGLSLPRVNWGELSLGMIILHTLVLTFLINIGKFFPVFCYRDEASVRQRLALSVAMLPRGEVGAGVLLLAIHYGLKGLPMTVAALSLAVNIMLSGIFILIVMHLLKQHDRKEKEGK